MIYYREKKYYSALEANRKFKIPLPTVYYWLKRGEFKNHILDLKTFCEEKGIEVNELRASFYIEEKILKEKARFLNYLPVERYSKRR